MKIKATHPEQPNSLEEKMEAYQTLLLKYEELEKKNQQMEATLQRLKEEFGTLVLSTKYFFDVMGPIMMGFVQQKQNWKKILDKLKETFATIKANPARYEKVTDDYMPTITRLIKKYAPAFEEELKAKANEHQQVEVEREVEPKAKIKDLHPDG